MVNFKSYILRSIFFFVLFPLGFTARASGIETGFEALKIRDYFKSKKIFESALKSKPDPYSAYGLSIIYYKNDNPWFNLDSAAKYAHFSFALYRVKPKPKTLAGFVIDSLSLVAMMDSVSIKKMPEVKRINTIESYNSFLISSYGGNRKVLREAVNRRDELEFNHLMDVNKSDTTVSFLVTHPQSDFYMEAFLLRDRQLFDEVTSNMRAESYRSFLKNYSKNAMVNMAYEKLFAIYKQNSDVKGLSEFVREFPNALQALDAWKLLFSLSVKSYSDAELTRFLETYPEFPLKTSILKELELNKLVLYRYQHDDLFGFVNDKGRLMIPIRYDEVTEFYEGLSVVSQNDTVFFINKENENPFRISYSGAYHFQNGIAPVKRNGKWHFINRQGQTISRDYDEISDLTGAAYIVKLNGKYGALNNFGQSLIEPRFEILGDFSNGFAYYIENGKYGFVSLTGGVHPADYDWISGFDTDHIAIVKTNQKFGLIASTGGTVLPLQYDLVARADSGIYIVVSGNYYGFYSAKEACFLSTVSYDYQVHKKPEHYTNGQLLKLQKKGQQALVNVNGSVLVPFGTYDDISFPSGELIKAGTDVKKEMKYGYVNVRLNPIIPFKYSQASDFVDSIAIVKVKDQFALINMQGRELYATESPINRLSDNYFTVNGEVQQIIDKHGKTVFTDVNNIQNPEPGLWIITVYGGEIKLLHD